MYYGTAPIVTNGLVLNLDPVNNLSIPVDPTVNLIGSNPIPVNNTSSYQFVLAWNITGSYNAASQSIEFNILNAPSGWVVNNTSLNTTVLDTGSLYTISFEWKIESGSTSLCRIWPQIATGNNATQSFTGVIRNSGSATYTANNTLLSDGFYKYVATFRPSHPGVNGDRSFRFLGGDVSGGQTLRMHWRKLQLERVPYATEFVSGSRNSWGSVPSATYSASLFNAAITGGLPYFNSPTDRVLNFDGTGSYAQTVRILTGSSYTAEFFFNASSVPLGVEKWLGSQYPGSDRIIFDIYTDNTLRNFMGNGTNPSSTAVYSTTIVQPNTWYHAVFSKDTLGTGSVYVNGVLEGRGAMSTGAATNAPFQIGGSTTLVRWFNGKISTTRLYNRALTQSEITQNYNALKSRFGLQ